MAQLTIISETGMFHSACCCQFSAVTAWAGFKPKAHRAPAGAGIVDTSDRSAFMNHQITFDVDEGRLRTALTATTKQYTGSTYVLAMHDCVSFSADLARRVGLAVPLVNMTPWGFLETLGIWNSYVSKS